MYVHADVYDKFVDGFVALTKQYVLDDPLDQKTTLGPMAQPRLAKTVRDHIGEALHKGAKALIDTKAFARDPDGSTYVAPQALVNVDHSMKVMMEETFGPVAGIMKVKDDAEAIRLMNDSPYGLTASIWTRDMDAAERIGARDRDRHRLHEPLRLSRSGPCLDRREGHRPRRDALARGLRVADTAEELSLEGSMTIQLRGNWNYPTTVRFGAGRASELGEAVKAAKITNPLFVTDPVVAKMPMTQAALEMLARGGRVRRNCSPACSPIRWRQMLRLASLLTRRAGMTAWWRSAEARRSMPAS